MNIQQALVSLCLSFLFLAQAYGQSAVPALQLTPATRVKAAPAVAAVPVEKKAEEKAEEAEGAEDDDADEAEADAAKKEGAKAEEKSTELSEEEKKKKEEEAKAKAEEAKKKAEAKKRKQEAKQRRTQRLNQFKQLNFDRRPSSILQAWSTPFSGDEEEEKAEENAISVEVETNEGFIVRGLLRDKNEKRLIIDAYDGRRYLIPQADVNNYIEDEKKAEPTEQEKEQKEKAKRDADEKKGFDTSLKLLQRHVTLGEWAEAKKYLATFDEELGKAIYTRLLQSLLAGPVDQPPKPGMPAPPPIPSYLRQYLETNTYSIDDMIGIADAAPYELSELDMVSLSGILSKSLEQGNVFDEQVAAFKSYAGSDEAKLSKRQIAKLIFGANKPLGLIEFLPTLEEAKENQDHEALNLLSRYHLALNDEEKKRENLEAAWEVTQAILASDDIASEEKEEALKRAVELAPQIEEAVGQEWLEESFTKDSSRGMEIIASIGSATSKGLQSKAAVPEFRLKSLRLQSTAVEALLEGSDELAAEWKDELALLAANWLREGEHSYKNDDSKTLLQDMQRDRYGNFYYNPYSYRNNSSSRLAAKAIRTGDLMEVRPGEKWLELVDEGMRPKYDMLYAQLYLKVAEDELAYPYIETLAKTHPEIGKDLVDEYIRVWTQNHDPNANKRRTNYYIYMYGYERKADGIPLTRSKQQRNLKELGELVTKLRQLPVELDEELLARAFTVCHSQAEVYQLEAIENVFGALDKVEPKTLAELAQQMRANLIGTWRDPATQKSAKTNRKKKDIQAEVERGYRTARTVIKDALRKYPEDWSLQLALASINHDENEYRAELEKDAGFSERRQKSFEEFKTAAELYMAFAKDAEEDEESTKPFETWWYASLGAVDLGRIDDKKQPDLSQAAIIREAIDSMPKEQADRHLKMFANTLFTRMSSIKPAVKYRYLKTGFEIAGDQKEAYEAKKVFDYYNDLVSEIRLETEVDGSDVVGQEPFGVFVNLVHTREIEREAGGFGKYLQNQNNGNMYYYNYGRPTENYRDKFEEIVTEALEEKFDILSVTFQSEDVNSRAMEEYGWRVTPYAYLLLKARGPEVDQIAPVRLDLDFLDTSGYAVLPIESSIVPVEASSKSDERPVKNLTVTQTLDERQADEGKLILEVKATAQGLVPELDKIVEVAPKEFDVANVEDQGIAVSRFDPDSEDSVVVSERTWMITMNGKKGLADHPKSFEFASVKDETLLAKADEKAENAIKPVLYQRFVDADLESVDRAISLEEQYGETSNAWIWWIVGLSFAGIAMLGMIFALIPKERTVRKARYEVPQDLTPFTVLGLLKDIEANNGISTKQKSELSTSINRIEKFYFGESETEEPPKLDKIAKTWVKRARG